jgi:hypothetical protein
MKRKTKREMVIEIYDREAMGEVTAREIAQINQGLVAEFGEGGAMAPAEIARVLADEELPVRYDQIFAMATPFERYEHLFDGVLRCESLDATEASIRRLAQLQGKFQRTGDRRGMRLARELAITGKRQAARLAQQATDAQRAEQEEIAQWLSVWLQTPTLFEQWLELRKAAPEFQRLFAQQSERVDAKKSPSGQTDA